MAVDLNYGVGVEGKNIVLKTLGRVYVKVKDRKYELAFKPEDIKKLVQQYAESSSSDNSTSTGILIVDTSTTLDVTEYPGDGTLVITRDGYVYVAENGGYTEVSIKFTDSTLSLTNLTLTGQLILQGTSPISISSANRIGNLNADLLDGYHGSEFGAIEEDEVVTGDWTFNGDLTFVDAISTGTLEDKYGKIAINFSDGSITCQSLTVADDVFTFDQVSGIGNEVWIGAEVEITVGTEREYYNEEAAEEILFGLFDLLGFAISSGELISYYYDEETDTDTELDETFWSSIFFTEWDEDEGKYTLKDFSDPTVWEDTNNQLSQYSLSLSDYQELIDAYTTTDTSAFTGNYYEVTFNDDIPILEILPNMIVKDNFGNIGYVVVRYEKRVLIRSLNESTEFTGTKLIVIGSLCREGGIVFNSKNPSLSILKNPIDESSQTVYFGQLSKIDESLSGIGAILTGSQAETELTEVTTEDILNFSNNSEIILKNPHITWGNTATVLNQDGSGYISSGNLRWNNTTLEIGDLIHMDTSGTVTGTILSRLLDLENTVAEQEQKITDLENNT